MKQYLDLIDRVLEHGVDRPDRTGVGTRAVFGHQMRFDLSQGFPMVTTKKLHVRSIIYELLWFLRGDTNVRYLQDNNVSIWNEWADENGDLGPVYGKQWRDWLTADGRHVDQIAELLRLLKQDPSSRRQIVSAWNVGDLPKMRLAPCHCLFQTAVMNGRLHLQLYQRSCDVFLGVPFNIASYALLGGGVPLNSTPLGRGRRRRGRTPLPLPKLRILRTAPAIDAYEYDDFELTGYEAHPHIKAEVAV